MKKRNTRISGDVTSTVQNSASHTGPRFQRAVMQCPATAITPSASANVSQNDVATPSMPTRRVMSRPPTTMSTSANASAGPMGTHQKSSGSTRAGPRRRKQSTRPRFDGLNTWRPRARIRYLERSDTAAVAAKIHAPRMLHQSPCSVPGTRRMNATPFPVSIALAGHARTPWRRRVITTSSTAHVSTDTRIWAMERSKSNAVCPSTCNVMITAARCRRGSRTLGRTTG